MAVLTFSCFLKLLYFYRKHFTSVSYFVNVRLYLISQESSLVLYSKRKENQPTNQPKVSFSSSQLLKQNVCIIQCFRFHKSSSVCVFKAESRGAQVWYQGVPGRSRWVFFVCLCVHKDPHQQAQWDFLCPGSAQLGRDWGPGPRSWTNSESPAAGEILRVHMHINLFSPVNFLPVKTEKRAEWNHCLYLYSCKPYY